MSHHPLVFFQLNLIIEIPPQFPRLEWTGGNCGTKAIKTFKDQHQCNFLCQLLSLDRLNDSPLLEDSLAPPPPPPPPPLYFGPPLTPPNRPPNRSSVVASHIPNNAKK